MLHQLEEHEGDRFRAFVNTRMGGGRELLTRPATFFINSVGVWGIDLIALYLALYVSPGLGLIAVYLTLVNALVHIAGGIALRAYNPGLWSAVALFVPVGVAGAVAIENGPGATAGQQALALAIACGVHIAIIGYVRRRREAS